MTRAKAIRHKLFENPQFLLLAILIFGAAAGLIWGIFTFKWLVFVRYYIDVVLDGCVEALALLKSYPPFIYVLILFTLLLAGLLYSGRQLHRKLSVNRLLGGSGQQLMAGASRKNVKLNRILEQIRTVHGKSVPVYLIQSEQPVCLVQGLTRPRIVISSSVCRALTEAELEAALLHEIHHLERKDPLRRLLAEAIADFLFFIPVVKSLVSQHTYSQELAADRFAVDSLGHSHHLASAIVRMASGVGSRSSFASFLGRSSLSERVSRLLGRPHEDRKTIRMASLFVSLVFALSVYFAPFAIGAPATVTKNLDVCAKQCISSNQKGAVAHPCLTTCGHKR